MRLGGTSEVRPHEDLNAAENTLSPTHLLVPTYIQMLRALSAWLAKASTHNPDDNALLSARLAPDMFPLSTQVRFSCVQAYEGVAWLRAEAFPQIWHDLLEEGRNGRVHPGTLADAQSRINETLSFLEGLRSDELDAGAERSIELELPDGTIFDMTRDQYVRDWAVPQFYFHVMTAYAILRNQGVDLGKADYVQQAFAYLRPDMTSKSKPQG